MSNVSGLKNAPLPCNLTPNVEGFRDPLCRMCHVSQSQKRPPATATTPSQKSYIVTTHPIKRTDYINKVMDRNR
jgi:hypothetical protein